MIVAQLVEQAEYDTRSCTFLLNLLIEDREQLGSTLYETSDCTNYIRMYYRYNLRYRPFFMRSRH